MKKLKTVLCAVLLCCLCIGLSACGTDVKDKQFSKQGLTITLNTSFYEKEILSQTIYLESADSLFCATKDSFVALGSQSTSYTLSEYCRLIIRNNSLPSSTEIKEEDGLTTFDYERSVSGRDFYYKAFVFKGSDAFWLCQFACAKENSEKFQTKFIKWAKTIVVE